MQPTPDHHQRIEESWAIYGEIPGLLAALSKVLHAELRPRTFIERSIVDTIAISHWRQSRLRTFEKAMLESQTETEFINAGRPPEPPAHTATRAFRSLIDQSRAFSLIAREDARCSGTIADSLRLLAEYRRIQPDQNQPDQKQPNQNAPDQNQPNQNPSPNNQPEEDTFSPEEVAYYEIADSDPPDEDIANEAFSQPAPPPATKA